MSMEFGEYDEEFETEFGKKNKLAAQAMKLSWKKGISLKQAWKIVRKKKGSKSGRTKRKNKLAAQAMKLSWKKGISLKQAWKSVKKNRTSRFGVLSDYDMNYTKSGLPRKPCDPNTEYRNPDSGRCIKIGSKTDLDLRARGIYPPGQGPSEINFNPIMLSRSASMSSTRSGGYDLPPTIGITPLILPQSTGKVPKAPGRNYEWYPGWQQWRKKCKPGYERNYETRRCRKSSSGEGMSFPSMSRVPSMSRSASGSRYAAAASADWVGYAGSSAGYDDMMYTKTGELRKPCNPDTEYRNPVTKRCVKIGGATDMQLRQGAAGPSGLSREPSGLSSLSSASSAYDDMMYTKTGELRKPCNPDTEYRNPITKRCVKIGGPTDMKKRLLSGEPLNISRSGSGLSALSRSSSSSRSGSGLSALSRSSSSGRSEDLLDDSLYAYEPPRVPGIREPLMSGYKRVEDDIFSFGRKNRRRTCFGSCDSCRVR